MLKSVSRSTAGSLDRRVAVGAMAAAMLVLGSGLASAAEDYCLVPHTKTKDARATATFQRLERIANPKLMGLLTGTWFHQIRSPGTNQIDNQYQIFQRNGLFSYVDFVCDGQNRNCSRYDGIGLFAVVAQPGQANGFTGLLDVSDLNRDHLCVGLSGRFLDASTFVDASNIVSRRVR